VRLLAGVALACLVLAGTTACGGGAKQTPLERAQHAAQKQGDQIKKRLEQAGFNVGGFAGANKLTPEPQRVWQVKVDFTSPKSFTLTILVFATVRQARRWERSYERQCAQIPACKAQGGARVGRVEGNVVYSAQSDDFKTPVSKERLDQIVAIASEPANG
jgi:hypothetical protein